MRWLKIGAINVLVLVGLFVLIEGSVSLLLVLRDVTVMAWEAAPYSNYDPDLGWIGRRDASIPDFWGKGVGVRTNSQRFRATYDIAPQVAPGKTRVVCSGDSFTFGDGVDNAQTWCQQLAARDPRIEPVNLGQGGYGSDQSYLRFVRDTAHLAQQVHLFAFIDDDFRRMQSDTFLGFGKPVLTLENGVLLARNVPVPRTATSYPWLIAIPRALMETRTVTFMTRVLHRFAPAPPPTAGKDADTQAVLRAMFAELRRVGRQRGSTLYLVHLPTIGDLGGVNAWTPFLEDVSRTEGIPLIDVIPVFRARTDARSLYLTTGTASGHMNAAGHALVADVVAAQLASTLR